MKRLAGIAVCLLLVGCARFTTTQTDLRYDEAGKVEGIVKTRATCFTFFDSKNSLANFKASQTEKTQTASVGALTQEASSTNAITALQAIAHILELLRPTP